MVQSQGKIAPSPRTSPRETVLDAPAQGSGRPPSAPSSRRTTSPAHDPFNPQAPNQCPVCGREYKSPCGMRQHYMSHFSPKHRCDFEGCTRAFKNKYLLTRHKRTHSALRPFHCPADGCGKRFTRKNNMQAHLRKHMPAGELRARAPVAKRSRSQLTRYARGGRTPEFGLEDFPDLARYIVRVGVPPTAAEAVERATEILQARKDDTRKPTLQKMHNFARKLNVTLSKPNNRRRIYYPPVEKAVEESDLQTYLDNIRSTQEKQVCPRAQTTASPDDTGDVLSFATSEEGEEKAVSTERTKQESNDTDAARLAETPSRSWLRQTHMETAPEAACSVDTLVSDAGASDDAVAPGTVRQESSRLSFDSEVVNHDEVTKPSVGAPPTDGESESSDEKASKVTTIIKRDPHAYRDAIQPPSFPAAPLFSSADSDGEETLPVRGTHDSDSDNELPSASSGSASSALYKAEHSASAQRLPSALPPLPASSLPEQVALARS